MRSGSVFGSMIGDNLAAIGFPEMPGSRVQTMLCWQTGSTMVEGGFKSSLPFLPLLCHYHMAGSPCGSCLKGSSVGGEELAKRGVATDPRCSKMLDFTQLP